MRKIQKSAKTDKAQSAVQAKDHHNQKIQQVTSSIKTSQHHHQPTTTSHIKVRVPVRTTPERCFFFRQVPLKLQLRTKN